MEILIILGAIIVIIVAYFAGKEFKAIAEMKGHDGERYFWWSFLVGVVGMLMVVALPDRSKGAANDYPVIGQGQPDGCGQSDDLPDL